MRSYQVGTLIGALAATALASSAAAQRSHGPGGAATAVHGAAPAFHFSAPAARFSAPASRFNAPGQRFSPSAPRTVMPLGTGPHFVAPGAVAPNAVAPHVAAPFVASPGASMSNVAPSHSFGPATSVHPDAAGSLQSTIRGHNGGVILRNPAFANMPARDPAGGVVAQATFAGRFAHSIASGGDRRRHHFGRVIGFFGAVFWPYAYDDFIDYTFSPYAYDTFWPYAYDDVIDGIYGPYAPDYSNYVSAPDDVAGGTVYVHGDGTGAWVTRGARPVGATLAAGSSQICSGQAEGLGDVPIERIAQQVKPDQGQQALLEDLRLATAQAFDVLRAACPTELPSTPTGRLAAVRSRVEAMLQAVRLIDPALQKFYRALSDEQKERFNAADPQIMATGENQKPDTAQPCNDANVASLPLTTVEQALRLNDAQQVNLNALKEASIKAGDMLKAACPREPALTPPARLAQMKRRLEAMIQVLDTVQPALVNFYASLDDEGKARFNRFNVPAP